MLQRLVVDPEQFQDQHILLTPEQRHYLMRVLRLRPADRFIALDGRGSAWTAQLLPDHDGDDRLRAAVLEPLHLATELPVAITLIAALPKGSGFDEVVRQSTELGVACIAPVISDRTLLHPSSQKLERWRRIAQEAAEQSERQVVPTLLEPVGFQSLLTTTLPSIRYLCVTRESCPLLLDCLQSFQGELPAALAVAIGPEGGWTELEIGQAIDAGFQPVSLGARILRAVTAPIVALSLVGAIAEQPGGRWNLEG